ncbi:MAG TPA: cyclase [Candidatus Pacebacteria bacterium]|nr:cyclase [Candidatus Paceibacterota bacterium]
MKVIDLTLPLLNGMPVFPGDPEVKIYPVQVFEKDQWNMLRLEINGHDGTHVNVPLHATDRGKNLDDYQVEDFFGLCRIFQTEQDIQTGKGVIFTDHDLTYDLAEVVVKKQPKFVGLSSRFEFDIDVERFLLQKGVISFERLAQTDQLPKDKAFLFYGLPLKIRAGDGSPVRAMAVIED